MARLAVAPHAFGEETLRLQNEENLTEGPQTHNVTISRKPSLNLRTPCQELKKDTLAGCTGACESRIRKLVLEKYQLAATIDELKKTLSDQKQELNSLVEGNARLQASTSVTNLNLLQRSSFDRRLAEIEQALTHGLTQTLNTLQSLRSGPRPTGMGSNSNQPALMHSLELSSDNLTTTRAVNRLVITAGPILDIPSRKASVGTETSPAPKTLFDEYIPELDFDDFLQENDESQASYAPQDDDNMGREYSFGSQIEKIETAPIPKKEKKVKVKDDFDDITFFLRPPSVINKQPMNVNDRLSRALKLRKNRENASENLNSDKKRVRDEDEISNDSLKRASTRKRKALTPISKNSSNRPSSAGLPAKKSDDKAFDFVEKSTLLEQSRSSLKRFK